MSSRVLPADDPRGVGPVPWRQVADLPARADGASDGAAQLAAMEQQWEQRVRAAHTAGFSEGETAGRTRAAAEVQPVIERLARSIEELGGMRATLRRECEADIVKLSLAIARRVLRREMAVDPDAMQGLVVAALQKIQAQDICRVRVHPSHAAQLTKWLRESSGTQRVEVLADNSREPGSLIFETDRGDLDGSVDSQLQEIERGLADRLRKSS
jgi:flagellar assembly protein FliH